MSLSLSLTLSLDQSWPTDWCLVFYINLHFTPKTERKRREESFNLLVNRSDDNQCLTETWNMQHLDNLSWGVFLTHDKTLPDSHTSVDKNNRFYLEWEVSVNSSCYFSFLESETFTASLRSLSFWPDSLTDHQKIRNTWDLAWPFKLSDGRQLDGKRVDPSPACNILYLL